MDMVPQKRAWAGSVTVEGTYSKTTLEKPPMSPSDMVLHNPMVEGSVKSKSSYGAEGTVSPSCCIAGIASVSLRMVFHRHPVTLPKPTDSCKSFELIHTPADQARSKILG